MADIGRVRVGALHRIDRVLDGFPFAEAASGFSFMLLPSMLFQPKQRHSTQWRRSAVTS
jgi:hypothetical protein